MTHRKILLVVLLAGFLPLAFNQCGLSNMAPQMGGKNSSSLVGQLPGHLSSCEGDLAVAFAEHLYPFAKSRCAACHIVGGQGNGAFADNDFATAFAAYNIPAKRSTKIFAYALDPAHQVGYTGPQHQSAVQEISPPLLDAEAKYAACAVDNPVPTPPPIVPPTPSQFFVTNAIAIGTVTAARDITFDLNTAIPGKSFPGGQLIINVQSLPNGPGFAYQVTNVRLRGATASALVIKTLYIDINSAANTQITFATIDRKVAANVTSQINQAGMVIPVPAAVATDTIRIRLATLDATTFTPRTFAADVGPLFTAQCNSCHTGAGAGGNFQTTSRASVVNTGYAVAFSPAASTVLARMRGQGGSIMPTTGMLPAATIQIVEDWIYNGAP